MKKEGKRSKKKHLSKEAFRKIRYKQNVWRVYKHTGKDKDCDAYKEALNAATNEVRQSKRNFEHTLAQHIKSDSKSLYAHVRSKQNVRDKVGPLESGQCWESKNTGINGRGIKEALYRIWCGANRLDDSGVHTLGDNSAFVYPAGQLLFTRRVSYCFPAG